MLTKDDPVYYKIKLQKLLKDAKDNNLIVEIKNDIIIFANKETKECTIVNQ